LGANHYDAWEALPAHEGGYANQDVTNWHLLLRISTAHPGSNNSTTSKHGRTQHQQLHTVNSQTFRAQYSKVRVSNPRALANFSIRDAVWRVTAHRVWIHLSGLTRGNNDRMHAVRGSGPRPLPLRAVSAAVLVARLRAFLPSANPRRLGRRLTPRSRRGGAEILGVRPEPSPVFKRVDPLHPDKGKPSR
jgi:hypothetical protein